MEHWCVALTDYARVVQYDYLRCEFLDRLCRILYMTCHIAALYVALSDATNVETDIIARFRFLYLLMVHFYALDFTLCARRNENKLVVYLHRSCFNTAHRHSTNTGYAVNVLNRQSQRFTSGLFRYLKHVKSLDYSRALVPCHVFGFLCNIVAQVT